MCSTFGAGQGERLRGEFARAPFDLVDRHIELVEGGRDPAPPGEERPGEQPFPLRRRGRRGFPRLSLDLVHDIAEIPTLVDRGRHLRFRGAP